MISTSKENKSDNFVEGQFNSAYPDGIENHYWIVSRNYMILDEVIKNKKQITLDVGCGRGIVVNFLRKKAVECYGVELSNLKISDELKPYIETGKSAEAISILNINKVNTILLLDVLEHIKNPKAFLVELITNFPSVDKIIVSLPARSELWSNYDEYYGHYRRYSIDSIDSDFLLHNWEVSSKKYAFKLLYLPALILAKFRINRGTTIQTPPKNLRSLHFLVAMLIRLVDVIIPNWVYGTSIFFVIERKYI